jgi:trk system potassium uptake protein TrkH
VNLREVLHLIGALLTWTAVAMVPSTLFAVSEGLAGAWVLSTLGTAAVGGLLWWATPRRVMINAREGLAVVGLGWFAVVLAGTVPYLATGVTMSPAAAFFESVSGFTTTGATIFSVIEELPRSILVWRSVSHWIGGMGIIVLGVAVLPLIGMGGAQLFRAETPGIASDRLTPRIASTARLLWGVYAGFTLALAATYVLLGMPVFDAINHAMSCLATGGFSTRTASLGAYSAAVQWVTILFMLIAATNFTLHYRMLTGRWTAWFTDIEWRWFASVTFGAIAVVAAALAFAEGGANGTLIRTAMFNVMAVVTTTGFATADFALWPVFCQVVLLGLMFVGAMGGSTGGGFKVVRFAVVVKHAAGEIRKVLHPRAVLVTTLGRHPIKGDVLLNVLAYLTLYVATHAIGTALLAAMGLDLVTATSAALAAMSSIGPGLGGVGPAAHYGDLSPVVHLILAALMLLGRLEFYTILVLFLPGTWQRWGGNR